MVPIGYDEAKTDAAIDEAAALARRVGQLNDRQREQFAELFMRGEEARLHGSLANQIAGGSAKPCVQWPPAPPLSERVTLNNVDDVFRYHQWDPGQQDAGNQVRDALIAAAKVILRTVPESPSRTRALNHLIDARMVANAAITFGGRF